MGKKKSNVAVDASLTLAQLTEHYIKHLETEGKAPGTCFSYRMEMRTAEGELGAEVLVASLTPEQIEAFNKSRKVMRLKSGKSKSQLSIDKTRRVLRLALAWAEQAGLIEKSPIAAKAEPAPAKSKRKTRVVVDEPAPVEQVATETAA